MQTQPFTPDDIYCVYCHAPAAGPCAVCGALCCADCVELVMGLTVRRAVCRSCLKKGEKPAGRGLWRWIVAAFFFLAAVALLIAVFWGTGTAAGQDCDADLPEIATVIAAIYTPNLSCDLNADGGVTAADVTMALMRRLPTPTPSPSLTATPTPTATSTATATPTGTLCPEGGADLVVNVDNRTGFSAVTVNFTGERTGTECGGPSPAAYDETRTCAGDGASPCLELNGVAPGSWLHSVRVVEPDTGQIQHRASLLVNGRPPNQLQFTAFASVAKVTTDANDGDGSLRKLIRDAGEAVKPLLIQFDPRAFPPGVPSAIDLEFAIPVLATDDVTIDGTDATGAAGNRIVDAGGLPIGVLSITGARNHLIGLRLRGAGEGNRDVLNISGPQAEANLVERTIIDGAATADGIGIDQGAGKDFEGSANVLRNCEVSGASDKGIKVTTGSYARVEDCWVHDNINGGIQTTLGGHVQAWQNLVERNRGGTAQNGLSANPPDNPLPGEFSELLTRGNISRDNGANGVSIRASAAEIKDDYLAGNRASGLRVFNDVGNPASAQVEGTSAVCNGVDGVVIADTSTADLGGGAASSPGQNAFAQNNLPGGGANLRNATGAVVHAVNSQWENCGTGSVCDDGRIAALDLSDHGLNTVFSPAQAHRAQVPGVGSVSPTKGQAGELLRIFGSGFNVIDGHFAEDNCADVVGRNRCIPLRGNCVRIGGVSAPVEAVTPTMLVVRWPFTCIAPVSLVVTIDQGPTGASSEPVTVCTNVDS